MSMRVDRRADRLRRRQTLIAVLSVAALLVVVVAVVALGGGEEKPVRRTLASSTTTTTVAPEHVSATTLTTIVDELIVYSAPDAASPEVTRLNKLTRYGVIRTLMMTDGSVPGWYQALLPIRPNGSTGWVKAEDVTVATTDYEIKINLAKHTVKLLKGGKKVLQSKAVIGKPETPTPPGQYYVTDPVNLTTRRGSDYGAFALGISGFSEVLLEFEDGPGQLAVHGTPRPEEVGQDLSNGCVRVPDDVILKIAEVVPLGTPVTIVSGLEEIYAKAAAEGASTTTTSTTKAR